MTPQLYTKLTAQIERQQPELADYQAQADALQPTIDSAQQWVDACQAQVDKISAAINALRERPADAPEDWQAPDTSAQQAALDAATDTLNQALKDLAAPTAVQAGLLERAAALRAAIGQCRAGLEGVADPEALRQAADATAREEANARRVAALWQAAHDYEFAQVSGSAIGLLAMGVMMGKPKCLAVQGWIKSIWAEYYSRKASGSTSTDFSKAGPCPHSVPELMDELGV